MTHKNAAIAVLVTVIIVPLYLLVTGLLGVREYWAGFLFLSQWGLMEQARVERLPHSVVGAVTGTVLAALFVHLPVVFGVVPGLILALLPTLFAVYALTMGWLPMAINAAAMIFLTVVTIPEIARAGRTDEVFLGLAAGVVLFGGPIALLSLSRRKATGTAVAVAAPETVGL